MNMSTNPISQSGDFRIFAVTGVAALISYLLVWIYNQLSPFDRQLRLSLQGQWKLPRVRKVSGHMGTCPNLQVR
jgi:hypothetical protein